MIGTFNSFAIILDVDIALFTSLEYILSIFSFFKYANESSTCFTPLSIKSTSLQLPINVSSNIS